MKDHELSREIHEDRPLERDRPPALGDSFRKCYPGAGSAPALRLKLPEDLRGMPTLAPNYYH